MRRTTKYCQSCAAWFRVPVMQSDCGICGGSLVKRNPSDKAAMWESLIIGSIRRAKEYLNMAPSTESVAGMLGCPINTAATYLEELSARGVVACDKNGKWRIVKSGDLQ